MVGRTGSTMPIIPRARDIVPAVIQSARTTRLLDLGLLLCRLPDIGLRPGHLVIKLLPGHLSGAAVVAGFFLVHRPGVLGTRTR